jgi:hypothetical protein
MADGQSVTFSHPNFGLITVIEWRVDRIVITLEDAGNGIPVKTAVAWMAFTGPPK